MELEITKKQNINDKNLDIDFKLNLYNRVPFGLLTLEECEDLFRQRLEAFAILEKFGRFDKNLPELTSTLRNIRSYVYKTNCLVNRVGDTTQQKQDHFSHMLMRMFCIYQSNLWPWFKQNERSLLYYRLRDQALSLSGAKFDAILKTFKFNSERVVGSDLNELMRENILTNKRDQDIFKVKFTDALKFVAKRSVPLKNGYAYLSRHEIISVVCDAFEKYLESELQYARQHFDHELMQSRQLLESMSLVYQDFLDKLDDERRSARRNQADQNSSPFALNLDNLEEVAGTHYPPCMRYLHESLLQDHHLKHQGRLHYGAFLRTAGIELDDAIEFWRKEFTKKIPNDKFERDYKYNIRHLYGKEGHKKALTCFSCDKLISSDPGPTEKHGCPFKHFSDDNLKSLLKKYDIKTDLDLEDVYALKKDKDFRGACSLFYEKIKGQPLNETISNPMQFYYGSRTRQFMNAKCIEEGQTDDIPTHAYPTENGDNL